MRGKSRSGRSKMTRAGFVALGGFLVLASTSVRVNSAPGELGYVRKARTIDAGKFGAARPAGLAFSPKSEEFYLMDSPDPRAPVQGRARVFEISLTGKLKGVSPVPAGISEPRRIAFSARAGIFVLLDGASNRLIGVQANADGRLAEFETPGSAPDAALLPFADALDMTADPENGDLFVLAASGLQIVRITPGPEQKLAGAQMQGIPVPAEAAGGPASARKIAFNTENHHLYIFNGITQKLYELAETGEVASVRDLSPLKLADPQAMLFAPSGDQTDDPSETSLYIAGSAQGPASPSGQGQIVELDLTAPVLSASFLAAEAVAGSLANIIYTSNWSPPSPDPAGIDYNPVTGRFLVSDSEVDEMGIWSGANLFEMTASGVLLRTFSTVAFSHEPTGAAHNASNGHLFISDDDWQRIFEIDLGPDGVFGTSDDVVRYFSTTSFGCADPEGVAYDSEHGVLFISDGQYGEVFKVSPGANGRFDGGPPAGDDVVTHFDTSGAGMPDTEGIEYNPESGTLYLVGPSSSNLVEMDLNGTVVRVVSLSAGTPHALAGVAYGESSASADVKSIFIVDRWRDNNQYPTENDGRVLEFLITWPVISSFSPGSGAAGTVITLTGSHFTGATSVAFNGQAAGFAVASDSSLTATVPAGATTGKISVTTPGGTGSSASNFVITAGTHDVAVTAVTAPTPVVVNTAHTVSVTVANQGAFAETFQVGLSDNLGATVGGPQTVTNLAAAGTQTLNFSWTPTATGTHTLTATAATVSGETDTADNIGTANSTVNPVPVHDVAVTGVTAPTPVTVNTAQTVSVTVANQGNATETFDVTLADNKGATVGGKQTITSLGAGGTRTLSFAWTPTEVATHTLTATAATVSGETDTADNVGSTNSIVNPVPVHDVAVTSVNAPTPVTVNTAHTVSVTVANQGNAAETFQVTLTDNLGATVGGPQTVTNLAAGGTQTLNFSWTPTATGTHTVTATAATVAGETDTADNVGTANSTVNPVPVHDVAVTGVTAPTPVVVNTAHTVSVTVANQGNAVETFQVTLTDSLGATIGGPQTVTSLAAGGTQTLNFAWTPTATGAHTLTGTAATVAGETDTADNAGTANSTVNPVPVHDVAVTGITAPTPVIVNTVQTVSVTVANQGNAAETFQVTLTDNLGATVGGPQTVTSLAAGGTQTLNFSWTPTGTGTHTLTATAATVAGETDTADNVGTANATVNPVPGHDVAVTGITAPTPVTVNTAQTVSVTVANQGNAAETFQVTLSDNLGATVGGPQTVTNLAAGGTQTLNFSWTPTATGAHTLTATAATVSGETDTADNFGTANSTVNPAPVHDVAVTGVVAPTPVIVNTTQTVSVTVANQGDLAESFQVTLTDSLGATIGGPQTVTNLAAAGTQTLNFSWTPTATGTHTLTATATTVAGETDIADNAGTANSIVDMHDVAVTVLAAPTPVDVNIAQTVSVTVANQGTRPETFQVTLGDNLGATVGGPQTVTNLAAGGTQTLNFSWTPTVGGTHTLTATAQPVTGETDTADNVRTGTSIVGVRPVVLSINPSQMNANATIQVTITGADFLPGAVLSFENGTSFPPAVSGLTVLNGGTTITATLKGKAAGPKGVRVWDVVITNPDGLTGRLAGAFRVIR